jgi:hypothetical protein
VSALEVAFWAAAAGAGWVLAGYPLALLALPRRPWTRRAETRTVSIVAPAYREYEELPRKLASLDALDYPRAHVEVIVVADGDPGLARLAATTLPRAIVLVLPERRGKAAALNRALAAARGEIVVFTDAANPLEPGSVAAAIESFADPAVAAVAGRAETGTAYQAYESLLRRLEARSGSVAAVSGGCLAVRRELIGEFPEGTINDDHWLLLSLVRGGRRVVYEPRFASHEPDPGPAGESERHRRPAAGRLLLLPALRGLPPGYLFRVASHKLGRLALPFLLATALAASIALAAGGATAWIAAASLQLVAYVAGATALAGLAPPGRAGALSRAAGAFVGGNLAVAAGVIRGLRGHQDALWRDAT